MSLRRSMIFSLGGAPPLDEVGATSSNTLVAYGLRKLSNNYSGPVLRVRNSVGAIGDLAFDSSNEVSTSSVVTITTAAGSFSLNSPYTLSAFAASGSVTVQTWYDQSGNARHISQSTVSNQPYLMLSGNFTLVDNKPSLFTNSEVRFFRNTSGDLNFWYYSLGGSVLISKCNNEFPLAQIVRGRRCTAFTTLWWGFRISTETPLPTDDNYYITAFNRYRIAEYDLNIICSSGSDATFYLIGDPPSGSIEPRFFNVSRNNFFTNSQSSIISFVDNNTATKTNSTTFTIGTNEQAGNPTSGSFMRAYLNGTASAQFNYIKPRVNVDPTSLFIFRTTAPQSGDNPNSQKIQEIILLSAINNFSERNIIEKNMGRYYNINVA